VNERAVILIVDDDLSIRRTLSLILQKKGYQTESVGTGQAVLESGKDRAFDLVLLDMRLPDVQGVDLIGSLKEMHPDIAIIVSTAYASTDTAIRAVNEGASAYITKPLDIDGLVLAIEGALEKQRLVRENRRLYESAQRELAERRRAEEALRESEETARALLNTLHDWAMLVDTDGTILGLNSAMADEFGGPAEALIGRCMHDLFPRDVAVFRREQVALVVDSREPLSIQEANAGVITEATVYPVFGACGEVTRLAVFARDVTEQKRLEEQMRQAEKMEAVGRLAGGVAHYFNNLLTPIIGYSELLLDRLDADGPLHEDVEEIRTAGERLATLIHEILAFSSKQILRLAEVDLNELVAGLEGRLRSLLGEGVDLAVLLDPAAVVVKADREELTTAIMSLASNGRAAMGDGGTLTIVTTRVKLSEKQCKALPESRPGCFACLSIADTGAGMGDETLGHLFEPFFTTKGIGEATGLGLSVVYGIAKQHDGWVSVESELGRGSTFKIYLPIHATGLEA